ncbi:Tn3 family transposase [Paraburkholderia terrae]
MWGQANSACTTFIREWLAVQRITASLGQKQVSQAAIVRKLSSYKRQNR